MNNIDRVWNSILRSNMCNANARGPKYEDDGGTGYATGRVDIVQGGLFYLQSLYYFATLQLSLLASHPCTTFAGITGLA